MHDVMHRRFEYAFLNKNKINKANDTATGHQVCIKRWERGDIDAVNEIAVLTSIKSKGVPSFICSFEDENGKYMVTDWIDGVTLEDYIKNCERISEDICISIIIQLCNIVQELHQSNGGYLHLDIKPSNIIINDKNEAFLIDFESAKSISTEKHIHTEKTVRIVSERFSAPELYFDNPCIESDVYSIGKVAEALLSKVDNSECIRQIVNKSTQFDICVRYSNPGEIIHALKNNKQETTSIKTPITALIDCNMCFAGELSNLMAQVYKLSIGVFALSEKGENRLVYYSMPGEYFTHRDNLNVYETSAITLYPTGFPGYEKNVLFYKNKSEWIKRKCLHKVSDNMELYISGMNFIEEILLTDYEEIQDFISWSKENFDVVLITSDRNDDRLTDDIMCCLCDYIITTPQSNVDDVEAAFQFFKTHSVKNGYDKDKVLYIAWDYDPGNSIPQESIKIMVGDDKYLGAINRTEYRQYKRNFVTEGRMEMKEIGRSQYEEIIEKILKM